MKPEIIDIRFLNEDIVSARQVAAYLSNGTIIQIIGLETCGQKSFEQLGGTIEDKYATLPLAEAAVKWLHGGNLRPNISRFLKKRRVAFLVTSTPRTRVVVDVPAGCTLDDDTVWRKAVEAALKKIREDVEGYLCPDNIAEVEPDMECPAGTFSGDTAER